MIGQLSLSQWLASALGVILTGAVGYLLRFIIERSHGRDMEELRSNYSRELEQLRSELGRGTIQFSQLHINRVDKMIDLYGKLLDLQNEIYWYLRRFQSGTGEGVKSQRETAHRELNDSIQSVHKLFRRNRFYFDESMYKPIERVFKHLYEVENKTAEWSFTDVTYYHKSQYDASLSEKFRTDIKAAHHIISGDLKTAIDSLEDTVREMLGVSTAKEPKKEPHL